MEKSQAEAFYNEQSERISTLNKEEIQKITSIFETELEEQKAEIYDALKTKYHDDLRKCLIELENEMLQKFEMKEAKNGSAYLKARLSVSMGQDKESSWFSVICFSDQAKNLFESWMKAIANKGQKSVRAIVMGKMEVSQYGENNEKTAVTIVADEIAFSTKFAVVGDVAYVQSGIKTDNVVVTKADPAAAAAQPAPVAQPAKDENDAPF